MCQSNPFELPRVRAFVVLEETCGPMRSSAFLERGAYFEHVPVITLLTGPEPRYDC